MDFLEVLDQVVDLLRQRRRLTYRTIKLQFNLDDEYLDALKDELIKGQRLAIDEDGEVLVWTGEPKATPVSASQPVQTPEQTSVPQVQPTQVEPPPEPHTPDAERRQLTIMFCDLVDSTRLSGQLDPEDLRDVIRAYQSTCADVIERYDGYIAQHLGDGLMVYFGWPQAHEDDAQRAVHAGMGILEVMGGLDARLEQEKGIRLAVRIGIHTGLVVVGEIGQGTSQEHLAMGETPNIASRIEGIAEPDTVAISDATYQLVQGYFVCEDLRQHALKGVDEPQQVYRVVGASSAQSRFDVGVTRGLTPLVGREQEVGLLFERWQQAKDGQGQVVLLSGEPAIGKSRLVQVLKEHVAGESHTRLECRSSPYFTNTALYPITDMFQRTLQFQPDDTPDERLEKLERELSQYSLPLEEAVPLFAPLLSLPIPKDRYPPLNLSPQRQRQKTLETLVAVLLQQTEGQPVLFILEDLHWIDPSTLELLDLLIDQTPTAALCVLLTCRPAFQPPWSSRSYLTQMTLNRLSRSQIERMVEQVADGKPLPAEVLEQITEKTDGVPLFVEELTKAVLESDHLNEVDGQYELTGSLSTLAIPATLQDSLMARLDRLVTAKAVAQYAAVIGRQFSYELLQAVSQLDEMTLQRELGRLVKAELIYQRGLPPQTTYLFKHALVVDTAYESLLKSTRQQYHQRIAQVLEERFAETAEAQPELLAYHCTEAGLNEQAIVRWHQAGQRAAQHSANLEAVNHLTKGLQVLASLPDAPERWQEELALQITLGPVLIATKGYAAPEVERAYVRAHELCQQVGETPQLFPAIRGLLFFHVMRAEYHTARELGEQLLSLAQRAQDPMLLVEAHRALATVLYWCGEPHAAAAHAERGMAHYDPQQHRSLALRYGLDSGTSCLIYAGLSGWNLGYPDQARRRAAEALTLSQDLSHTHNLCGVLTQATAVHIYCRDAQVVQEYAEAVITLATEQSFPQWLSAGTVFQGWARMAQGQDEEGLARMQQGLDAWRRTETRLGLPWYLAMLAEAHGKLGQVDQGLHLLAEAQSMVDETGERWCEAELYRLKGVLLLQLSSDNHTEAETCFHQALDIARRQQAKSWELRAASSLARLWQSQGKRQDAYDLLAPVYGWFTEGFDTADLQEAKALLNELAA